MWKRIDASIKQYTKQHKKLLEVVFLIAIFAFSLAIRRIAMKHGFPLLTHPDESTIINPVLRMTAQRTLNPGNFNRPDQVLYYLNFIYLNVISFLAYGVNVAKAFGDHVLDFYFYSRFLISVMGSLIPVVAYQIGKQFKTRFAFTAALVFTFFPLYVEHSVYITPDIPITLFTMLILYFTIRFVNTDAKRYLVFAAISAAINTAEKYPGVISLAIVIVGIAIHVFGEKPDEGKPKVKSFFFLSGLVCLTFLISLFIVAPYIFIEYQAVIDALIRESRSTHLGADNLGWLGNLWFYVETFYRYINIFGLLFIIIGIYDMLRSKQKSSLLLLYGFLYWFMLSALALHWERWALPMFIAPLFLIAIGINTLWNQRKRHLAVLIGSIVLALFFLIPQGIHAVYIPVRMKYTDTRLVSQYYCQENNITRENSLFEGLTPLRPIYSKSIFQEYIELAPHVDYIILSSFMGDRYSPEPERYADEINTYHNIRTENVLIKMFNPYPYTFNPFDQLENIIYFVNLRMGRTTEVRYKGPTIEIYKVP